MKTYSMKIKEYTFDLEIQAYRGQLEFKKVFTFNGERVSRKSIPVFILIHFDSFSEDMVDMDWDDDYGYIGESLQNKGDY